MIDKICGALYTMSLFFLRLYKRGKYNKFRASLNNYNVHHSAIFRGVPLVQITDNAELNISENVLINSENNGYHVNMFACTKIMADRPGAKISIGKNTRIHGSCIHAYDEITIGENCLIAANCQIIDCSGHDVSLKIPENRIKTTGFQNKIKIGNNVWICTGAIILPGVTIGDGSVISANSVVASDVPSNTVFRGNPAQLYKSIN